MILIAGLGNPTNKHKNNRHNAGFILLDQISSLYECRFNKKQSLDSDIALSEDIVFAKPTTFMNISGIAICKICKYYKIPSEKMIIIHDDLETKLGNVKIKHGGSANGHNGIKSIIHHNKSSEFIRIKIGISRPSEYNDIAEYVLSDFTAMELLTLNTQSIKGCVEALRNILSSFHEHQSTY